MHEMILNHASLHASARDEAVDWLKSIAVGIAAILRCQRVQLILRAQCPLQEIDCLPGFSFYSLILELGTSGCREEYRLLMGASTKVPLLLDLGTNVKERFHGGGVSGLSLEDGEPLLLCALTDAVAIGFPSLLAWDRDHIAVEFDEILADGDIQQSSETIDHLSRTEHADQICQRHRSHLWRNIGAPAAVWDRKDEAFPHLRFGPEVEHNLAKLQPKTLGIVIRRLGELDEAVAQWRDDGDPKHDLTHHCACKITPESDSVMQHPKLCEARRFASRQGSRELFAWHARFGNSGRIHLRIDAVQKEIEIGYIGPHLPL